MRLQTSFGSSVLVPVLRSSFPCHVSNTCTLGVEISSEDVLGNRSCATGRNAGRNQQRTLTLLAYNNKDRRSGLQLKEDKSVVSRKRMVVRVGLIFKALTLLLNTYVSYEKPWFCRFARALREYGNNDNLPCVVKNSPPCRERVKLHSGRQHGTN